jgi:hypothetical protein
LRYHEGKISQDEFYKIIEPEIEYVPSWLQLKNPLLWLYVQNC